MWGRDHLAQAFSVRDACALPQKKAPEAGDVRLGGFFRLRATASGG